MGLQHPATEHAQRLSTHAHTPEQHRAAQRAHLAAADAVGDRDEKAHHHHMVEATRHATALKSLTHKPRAVRTTAIEVHPSARAETLSAAAHTLEQHHAARQAHLAAGILAAEKNQDHIYAHHMREAARHQAATGVKPHAGVAKAPIAPTGPTQTGKKGGKFVISKSGKKRYV